MSKKDDDQIMKEVAISIDNLSLIGTSYLNDQKGPFFKQSNPMIRCFSSPMNTPIFIDQEPSILENYSIKK